MRWGSAIERGRCWQPRLLHSSGWAVVLLLLRCSRVRVVTHVAGKSCAGVRSGHIWIKSGTKCVNNNSSVNSMEENLCYRFLIFLYFSQIFMLCILRWGIMYIKTDLNPTILFILPKSKSPDFKKLKYNVILRFIFTERTKYPN